MNEKEVSELRRRYRQDRSNISRVRGCYVNEFGEILSQFDQSLSLMTQEEAEKLLAILKRTLSGSLGKNLNDITFATEQVAYGEEHKLLMALRDSALRDDEAVQAFYQKSIAALSAALEGGYLLLLASEAYDVPYRAKDGDDLADASVEVFSYIVCSVCPVKTTKPALGYSVHENSFHSLKTDWLVSPPELGFLFPAFDERSTNLYNALYYTKNAGESYAGFVESVFKTDVPMPAAVQKETFQSVLGETLEDECSLEVVQTVHDQLCGMILDHKEQKEVEPLKLSRNQIRHVLSTAGVSDQRMESFDRQFEEGFGTEAELSPKNLVDTRQLEVKTPDVTIRVNAERSDLVQTRVIDGARYILIRAEDGVEVNGVAIHIS